MKHTKVLLWDRGWAQQQGEFERRVNPGIEILASPQDVDWLLREIEDAAAIIGLRLPAEALPHARNLKAFLFPGAGILDSDPASLPAGCRVVNVYEHETPIAEYTLMMMLAHVTELRAHLATFAAGHWDGSGRVGGRPHGELSGRTLGLFGYGRIAQAIAARARAFGMKINAVSQRGPTGAARPLLEPDFFGGPSDLDAVLHSADFLVIAAPLTAETRGRIGARELALLPAGSFLVNVSRAEIAVEEDLFAALQSGHLGGAALDVWYQYPDGSTPAHGSRLPFHELANVYATPHYSAWTHGMILRRIEKMCETLNDLHAERPLDRVVLVGTWQLPR